MLQEKSELMDLTAETVWDFTEEDVFHLLEQLSVVLDKNEKSHYMKIIDSAFDFRTVSKKQRMLIESLSKYGFKFFPVESSSSLRGICKRKTKTRTVFG
jgi:hypothetical protein